MEQTLSFPNYSFNTVVFSQYHYTDNRRGAPMHYFAMLLEGEAKIVTDTQTLYLNQGDVFYIPKDLPYQSFWYGEERVSFLSFGYHRLETSEKLCFDLQKIRCEDTIRQQMQSIPTEGSRVTCRTLGLFYDTVSRLLPAMQPGSQKKEAAVAEAAKAYMHQTPQCTIPDVARHCSISEPYLYAIFRRVEHTTPNDCRQRILCQKGIELLTNTDKTVEEISSILHFSSAAHFRRVLKKHTGSTPREIRQKSSF